MRGEADGSDGITLLAVSGSLRAVSSNTAALEATRRLAPAGLTVTLYTGLAMLPPFNPDEDGEPALPSVADLRRRIAACDGLVISSPEYARGMPGMLKNALDWLVSGPEMPGKPAMLINTSPRASHAQAALALTLGTMSARVVAEAGVVLPLLGRSLDAAAIAADPDCATALRRGLDAFVRAIRTPVQ